MATSVYGIIATGTGEILVREGGVWSREQLSPSTEPRCLGAADDGTLFNTVQNGDLWRKVPEGAWTKVATSFPHYYLRVVSENEVWGSNNTQIARWVNGSGSSTWNTNTIAGYPEFAWVGIWAFASDNVIAFESNSWTSRRILKWDGASWSIIGNMGSNSGYVTAVHSDGTNIWVGYGGTTTVTIELWHHPAQGVGAGWTEITGAGWSPGVDWMRGAVEDIAGDVNDLWVVLADRTANRVDVSRTLNNGSTWTDYTLNPLAPEDEDGTNAGGMKGIAKVSDTEIYFGRINTDKVSVWNGSSFSIEDMGGVGGLIKGFTSYVELCGGPKFVVSTPTAPSAPCSFPTIDGDFTINNYRCLHNQFTDPDGDAITSKTVPFSLAHPILNLRKNPNPYSGSLG